MLKFKAVGGTGGPKDPPPGGKTSGKAKKGKNKK